MTSLHKVLPPTPLNITMTYFVFCNTLFKSKFSFICNNLFSRKSVFNVTYDCFSNNEAKRCKDKRVIFSNIEFEHLNLHNNWNFSIHAAAAVGSLNLRFCFRLKNISLFTKIFAKSNQQNVLTKNRHKA